MLLLLIFVVILIIVLFNLFFEVINNLGWVIVFVGVVLYYIIFEDIFYDREDGVDMCNLLFLMKFVNGLLILEDFWL